MRSQSACSITTRIKTTLPRYSALIHLAQSACSITTRIKTFLTFFVVEGDEILRVHVPSQQGLRRPLAGIVHRACTSQSACSITTRIKTGSFEVWLGLMIVPQSACSITTRIKTFVSSMETYFHRPQSACSITTRIKTKR